MQREASSRIPLKMRILVVNLRVILSLEKIHSKEVIILLSAVHINSCIFQITEDPFSQSGGGSTMTSGFASDPFAGDPFGSSAFQDSSKSDDAFDPFGALSIPPVRINQMQSEYFLLMIYFHQKQSGNDTFGNRSASPAPELPPKNGKTSGPPPRPGPPKGNKGPPRPGAPSDAWSASNINVNNNSGGFDPFGSGSDGFADFANFDKV